MVIGVSDLIGSTQGIPPLEALMGDYAHVGYNILAHLRKLTAKLSIYDSLILSKEIRNTLVKVLLDLEICLVELDGTSQAYQKTPIVVEESQELHF